MNSNVSSGSDIQVPLYVDLDGTLIRGDMLAESAIRLIKTRPSALWSIPGWLFKGKAFLKAAIAREVELDVSRLPHNAEVVALVAKAKSEGRRTVLATASNEKYADAIAANIGLFDSVLASTSTVNRSGRSKLSAITLDAAGPFDYVGNAGVDLPIWLEARRAIVVSGDARLIAKVHARCEVEAVLRPPPSGFSTWLRALRGHQWAKNLLIMLPALPLAGVLGWKDVANLLIALICFGACASSAYFANDLLDVDSDRQHPSKSKRPIPSGAISLGLAATVAPLLLLASFIVAALLLPITFSGVMAVYWLLTMAYSIRLKRVTVLDVWLLAALYTLRILAGAAVIGVMPSFWILAFSMFLFFSLASAKRYIELSGAQRRAETTMPGRGYNTQDLPLILAQGVAAGQIAVLVLALYIQDAESQRHFHQLYFLWIVAPLLLYWISRLWIKVLRGQVHDDPVVYALIDWQSRVVGLASGVLVWGAL